MTAIEMSLTLSHSIGRQTEAITVIILRQSSKRFPFYQQNDTAYQICGGRSRKLLTMKDCGAIRWWWKCCFSCFLKSISLAQLCASFLHIWVKQSLVLNPSFVCYADPNSKVQPILLTITMVGLFLVPAIRKWVSFIGWPGSPFNIGWKAWPSGKGSE